MQIRIEAVELPGLVCPPGADSPSYTNIHVAVQRRNRPGELLDVHAGNAERASWTLEATAAASESGIDLKGPFIQGRPGARFVYLSWGTVDEGGGFEMFRRAKLMLDEIPDDVVTAALEGGLLVGRLGLTDGCGAPLCARVVPPRITWSAESPDRPASSPRG